MGAAGFADLLLLGAAAELLVFIVLHPVKTILAVIAVIGMLGLFAATPMGHYALSTAMATSGHAISGAVNVWHRFLAAFSSAPIHTSAVSSHLPAICSQVAKAS